MSMLSPLDERTRKEIAVIVAKSNGSRAQADKAIRTLAIQDHAFLLGLVHPFLDGIVAHALNSSMPQPIRAPGSKPSLSASALDDLVRSMRLNIEGSGPTPAPSHSDPEAHADTIRALAAAQAQRRKENR
jgi:hypothetical protein